MRKPPFLDWPSDVQQMIAEEDLITSTLWPAAIASVMGEPHWGRNVGFCGVKIFRITGGKILERSASRTAT